MMTSVATYTPERAPALSYDFAATYAGRETVDEAIERAVDEEIARQEHNLEPTDRLSALSQVHMNGTASRAVSFAAAAAASATSSIASKARALSSASESSHSISGFRLRGAHFDAAVGAIAEMERNGFDPGKSRSMVWNLYAKGHRAHHSPGLKGPKRSKAGANFTHASMQEMDDPAYGM